MPYIVSFCNVYKLTVVRKTTGRLDWTVLVYYGFEQVLRRINLSGLNFCIGIGVARGCSGCTCTPKAVKKLGVNYRENCKCTPAHQVHPQAEQFRTFLLGGRDLEVYAVVLDRLLRAMTKKGRHFLGKKCTPEKILATPMGIDVARIFAAGMYSIFTPKDDDYLVIVFDIQATLQN